MAKLAFVVDQLSHAVLIKNQAQDVHNRTRIPEQAKLPSKGGDPGHRKQDLGLGGIEVAVCSQQRHGRQLENFATSPLLRRSQVL